MQILGRPDGTRRGPGGIMGGEKETQAKDVRPEMLGLRLPRHIRRLCRLIRQAVNPTS